MVGGKQPLLPAIFSQTDPVGAKKPMNIHSYASAITFSEKSSIITNRKSITNFQMSSRWTVVRCPSARKGVS